MKWIDFFTWSTILYLLYYGVNILLDVSRGVQTPVDIGGDNVLHFSEDMVVADAVAAIPPEEKLDEPVKIVATQTTITQERPVTPNKVENSVEGSGVTIKDFWTLAIEESVEYTKKVSFAQ
ncbi:MAG: hypothetical protein EOP45_07905 [Sphingobacteriaceae bacterium]|nr:MAG: hypothetical protein EOP45_07905 [Sphingobacteriaceae bacterium]